MGIRVIMNTAAMSFTPAQNHQVKFPISLIHKISGIPVLIELGIHRPLGWVAVVGFQDGLHLFYVDLVAGEELVQDADKVGQGPRLQHLGVLHAAPSGGARVSLLAEVQESDEQRRRGGAEGPSLRARWRHTRKTHRRWRAKRKESPHKATKIAGPRAARRVAGR